MRSLEFKFIPDEDTFDGLGHDRSPSVLEIHNRWSPWRHRRPTNALGGSNGQSLRGLLGVVCKRTSSRRHTHFGSLKAAPIERRVRQMLGFDRIQQQAQKQWDQSYNRHYLHQHRPPERRHPCSAHHLRNSQRESMDPQSSVAMQVGLSRSRERLLLIYDRCRSIN